MSQDVHYAEGVEASTTFLCLTVISPDFLAAGRTKQHQHMKSSPSYDEPVPFSHRQ